MESKRLEYRPDIDGLRAVAVLSVMWFHAGLPGLPGGYAGVDVFFVISGYLITSIIHRQSEDGSFTLRNFYERRVRRIAPALLLVTLTTCAAAYLTFLPFQLELFGQSAIAAVAMSSNVYFWRVGNYFALTDGLSPLIHTWSLGVEEQFYLLFPAAMLVGERYDRTKLLISLALVGSLAICLVGSWQWPVATFYLLPGRGWELMVGGALAVGIVSIPQKAKFVAGISGAALIGSAFLLFTGEDPYPGWRAIVPCLGTALLIGTGGNGFVPRVLAAKPIAYTGRLSYSLYLWHWPILVFLRQITTKFDLSTPVALAGLVLALPLSAASYHFVEVPCRDARQAFFKVGRACAVAVLAILSLSVIAITRHGLPERIPPEVAELARKRDAFAPLAKSCTDVDTQYALAHCRLGPPGPPQFVLWGDSHAAAMSEGVAAAFGAPGIVFSTGSCPPTNGWVIPGIQGRPRRTCVRRNAEALDFALQHPSVHTIVFGAAWVAAPGERVPAFWSSVQEVVDALRARGKRVIVLSGLPRSELDIPWASALRKWFGQQPVTLTCRRLRLPLRGVEVVDFTSGFCRFPARELLTDSSHPSRFAGLKIVAPALRTALEHNEADPLAASKSGRR